MPLGWRSPQRCLSAPRVCGSPAPDPVPTALPGPGSRCHEEVHLCLRGARREQGASRASLGSVGQEPHVGLCRCRSSASLPQHGQGFLCNGEQFLELPTGTPCAGIACTLREPSCPLSKSAGSCEHLPALGQELLSQSLPYSGIRCC